MSSRLPCRDIPSRWVAVGAALLLVGGLAGCHDTSKPAPPTSVATPEPEVIPGFEKSPSPLVPARPTPTPSPTPNTVPTPTPTPTPSATPAPPITIKITGKDGTLAYSPNPAKVKIGQQVRWQNTDGITHTATGYTPFWTTGSIAAGATSPPVTFPAARTSVGYYCGAHISEGGELVVEP